MKMTLSERFHTLFQEPFEALSAIGIREGQTVADIGAGQGYFALPAAETVGSAGLVYAIEPDRERSERIRSRATTEGLENIRVLTTGAEKLSDIQSGTVDLAFSVFSIHHFQDTQTAFAEIGRVLKIGGRFYVWDRVPGMFNRHGTRPEQLSSLSAGFSDIEFLSKTRTVKARFTK